jgi:hypothetical protein
MTFAIQTENSDRAYSPIELQQMTEAAFVRHLQPGMYGLEILSSERLQQGGIEHRASHEKWQIRIVIKPTGIVSKPIAGSIRGAVAVTGSYRSRSVSGRLLHGWTDLVRWEVSAPPTKQGMVQFFADLGNRLKSQRDWQDWYRNGK